MTPDQLRTLLDEVQSGRRPAAEAHRTLLATLRAEPLADLGFAKVDHHRVTRQGFPEVVLGLGKSPAQIAAIAAAIAERGHPLLVTRADDAAWEAVRDRLPEARYHEVARAITLPRDVPPGQGRVTIASAGTSDLPVAEEAAVTAELMGNEVDRVYDVGVAGIHRVLRERARLETARVIVVVAGMEGALPSVVAGMVAVPVIAVPTSVGYGASFGGIAALLGMLNSCANGVSVVNIDNGFGAGCIASMINHL
ncbi:MAG: nickel pincer cofactor biosynthesis protein LarB [Acidobacteria bacterium]|jgi:NCAIR mutase (PurE)-related protein|nr:nickel pincer cofactor biosynthesis protein LarB [Acidobacteriota bacterium]HQZ38163.1 nickel pincer cofactor biosynthesis protein LarB [Vicinamibacterales bacterium]